MKVYKRTLFNLIKSIVIAPCGGAAAIAILSIFISNLIICILAGIAACAALLYMAFFSENIYFEIDDDGAFRYFKRSKLAEEYKLSECQVGYHRKSDRGLPIFHDINLQILVKDDEHSIDCSPIGLGQFEEMFALMKSFTQQEPEVMTAKKE